MERERRLTQSWDYQTLKYTQPLCLHLEKITPPALHQKKKNKTCFQPPWLIVHQTMRMLPQWYGPYERGDFWLLDWAEGQLWKEASLIPVSLWIPVLFCSPPFQIRRFELYSRLKNNLKGPSSPAFLWIIDITSGGTFQSYSVHPRFWANPDASQNSTWLFMCNLDEISPSINQLQLIPCCSGMKCCWRAQTKQCFSSFSPLLWS